MSTASTVEDTLRAGVSAEKLQAHLNHFSTLFRDSGSADERAAAEYIHERMQE